MHRIEPGRILPGERPPEHVARAFVAFAAGVGDALADDLAEQRLAARFVGEIGRVEIAVVVGRHAVLEVDHDDVPVVVRLAFEQVAEDEGAGHHLPGVVARLAEASLSVLAPFQRVGPGEAVFHAWTAVVFDGEHLAGERAAWGGAVAGHRARLVEHVDVAARDQGIDLGTGHLVHRRQRAIDSPLALLGVGDRQRIGREIAQLFEPGDLAEPFAGAAEHVELERVGAVEAEPQPRLLQPVHVGQVEMEQAGELRLDSCDGVDFFGQLDVVCRRGVAAVILQPVELDPMTVSRAGIILDRAIAGVFLPHEAAALDPECVLVPCLRAARAGHGAEIDLAVELARPRRRAAAEPQFEDRRRVARPVPCDRVGGGRARHDVREQRQLIEVERAVTRLLAVKRHPVTRAEGPAQLVASVFGEAQHLAGKVVVERALAARTDPRRRGEGGGDLRLAEIGVRIPEQRYVRIGLQGHGSPSRLSLTLSCHSGGGAQAGKWRSPPLRRQSADFDVWGPAIRKGPGSGAALARRGDLLPANAPCLPHRSGEAVP